MMTRNKKLSKKFNNQRPNKGLGFQKFLN